MTDGSSTVSPRTSLPGKATMRTRGAGIGSRGISSVIRRTASNGLDLMPPDRTACIASSHGDEGSRAAVPSGTWYIEPSGTQRYLVHQDFPSGTWYIKTSSTSRCTRYLYYPRSQCTRYRLPSQVSTSRCTRYRLPSNNRYRQEFLTATHRASYRRQVETHP